jgi:hypothetical protein
MPSLGMEGMPAPAAAGHRSTPLRGLGLMPLVVGAWLLCAGAGLAAGFVYDNTPGRDGPAAASWPADVAVRPAKDRATLLVFLHPRCPCSSATLTQVEEIVARQGPRIDVRVHFARPGGVAADWSRTELRERAEEAGLGVADDFDCVLARRFGAVTSGTTLLYDAEGRLVFRGGLTASRGHAGGSPGLAAVLSYLARGAADAAAAPVFGCPLEASEKR